MEEPDLLVCTTLALDTRFQSPTSTNHTDTTGSGESLASRFLDSGVGSTTMLGVMKNGSISPISSNCTTVSNPDSPFLNHQGGQKCRVSPNKSHDSGYSDSDEGSKYFLEDVICHPAGDIGDLKENLRQLESDYIKFERERSNILPFFDIRKDPNFEADCAKFERERSNILPFFDRGDSTRTSIRELFRFEQNTRLLQDFDEEYNFSSLQTVVDSEVAEKPSDPSYVTQVYVSCSGDVNTSIVKQDEVQKTITLINDAEEKEIPTNNNNKVIHTGNNKVIKIKTESQIVISGNGVNNNNVEEQGSSLLNRNKTLLRIAPTKKIEEVKISVHSTSTTSKLTYANIHHKNDQNNSPFVNKTSQLLQSPSKVLAVNGGGGSQKTLLISYDSDNEQSLESLTDRLFAADISGNSVANGSNFTISEKSLSQIRKKSAKSEVSSQTISETTITKPVVLAAKSTAERRLSGRFSRDDFSRISSRRGIRASSKLRHTKSDLTLHSSATVKKIPEAVLDLTKSADQLEGCQEAFGGSSDGSGSSGSPVNYWVQQIKASSEPECNNILQSKTISGVATSTTLRILRKLSAQGRHLAKVFIKLCRDLRAPNGVGLSHHVKVLETGINSMVGRYNRWSYSTPVTSFHRISRADQILELHQGANTLLYNIKMGISRSAVAAADSISSGSSSGSCSGSSSSRNMNELVAQLREFGSVFTDLIEALLTDIVKESLDTLDKCRTESCLKDSLYLIAKLGLEGNHICRIFAREGGVATLIKLLAPPAATPPNSEAVGFPGLKGAVLRALGTICCVEESIDDLQARGGLDILAETLRSGEEKVQMEAAGVMAQITSPWIGDSLNSTKLDEHAYDIVSSLTDLCSQTKSSETLLLCAAALANLSYQSPLFLTAMSQLDSVAPLLTFIYGRVSPSIYILDQIATILANLSASHHTRESLTKQDLVPALLLLLAADPDSTVQDPTLPVLAATQRVQQKAAIAIGRLAVYPGLCVSLVSGGGLERLVELAVCSVARLDSDYTLVSVVTAVRKIAITIDIRCELERLGAVNLLESDILHSIKLYSPLQESFV